MTTADGETGVESEAALRLLQIYVVLLLVIPSNATLAVVGAAGYPASLWGLGLTSLYVAWTLLGHHRPYQHPHPVRVILVLLWGSSLASYVASQFRDRILIEINGADRWMLTLASLTGVVLVAAEGLRTMSALFRLLRTLVLAGAFCGLVAAVQYWANFDMAAVIGQALPGFVWNGDIGGIQTREALNRVPGTTLHPLELGAVAALLVPIAIAVTAVDRGRPLLWRVVPLLLVLVCVPTSVSRSALLSVGLAVAVLALQANVSLRITLIAAAPVAVVAVFALAPGFLRTIGAYFSNVGSDASVTTRTDDYALLGELFGAHPVLGRGGGTYLPSDLLAIFDNTYLKWLVEFGLVGAVVLAVLLILPVCVGVVGRRRAADRDAGLILGALGAGLASAAVSAATFDSLAFPTFSSLQFLAIGLVAAAWRLAPCRDHHYEGTDRMDTLNTWRALRRNAIFVVPVVVAAVVALLFATVLRAEQYVVTSTVLLVPPRAAPTDVQLLADPKLQGVKWNNPYTRQYDPVTLVAVLSIRETSPAARDDVVERGGTEDYEIEQVGRYGLTTPFAEVTARGSTPEDAVRTNELVVSALERSLQDLQSEERIDQEYYIQASPVLDADVTQVRTVSSTRLVLAVLVLALFGVFAAVAIGDALRIARGVASVGSSDRPGLVGRPANSLTESRSEPAVKLGVAGEGRGRWLQERRRACGVDGSAFDDVRGVRTSTDEPVTRCGGFRGSRRSSHARLNARARTKAPSPSAPTPMTFRMVPDTTRIASSGCSTVRAVNMYAGWTYSSSCTAASSRVVRTTTRLAVLSASASELAVTEMSMIGLGPPNLRLMTTS